MKKSLVAVATLSVIGTAFADVDVSGGIKLYGVLDQAYTSQALTNPVSSSGNTIQYNSLFASSATSRFGVKGNRDLGDGIKGRVQFELQLEPDNSALLNSSKNRTGFVALSKEGAGEIQMGTQETTAYEIFGMDVNGRVEYKPQVWRTVASNDIQDRANNAVKYVSPEFAGITVHAQKGFSDLGANYSTTYPQVFTALGAKYHMNNFRAAFVYDRLNNQAASYRFAGIMNAGPSKDGLGTASTGQSSSALTYAGSATQPVYRRVGAMSYDFGSFAANYIYAKSYATTTNLGSNTTNTFGVKVPFEKITLAASYGVGVIDSSSTTVSSSATIDAKIYDTTLGFYYNLDKSTNIYTLYSQSYYNGGSYQNGANRTYAIGARYNF